MIIHFIIKLIIIPVLKMNKLLKMYASINNGHLDIFISYGLLMLIVIIAYFNIRIEYSSSLYFAK